jgi:hypothetical protein
MDDSAYTLAMHISRLPYPKHTIPKLGGQQVFEPKGYERKWIRGLLRREEIYNNPGRKEIGRTTCGNKNVRLERRIEEGKTYTLPPRSFALSVTMSEPTDTITTTPVKMPSACAWGACTGTNVVNNRPARVHKTTKGYV